MSAYRLTPLEVACGAVLDGEQRRPPRPVGSRSEEPVAALECALLPALLRPPCLVSFSGGRDSSAVLAAATRLARREGLPMPIPATNRFVDAEKSDETEWQEAVIHWLGLTDWIRLELTDELDVVGPVATGVLERHGLLWPSNAHFHVPLFELAEGGSLLTGVGGDEVLGPSRWARVNDVLYGRARPAPRDVLRVAFALAPPRIRRVVVERRLPPGWPWLRPHARRAVTRALAAAQAGEPLRWEKRLHWLRGSRYLEVGLVSLGLLGADSDVEVVHPLLDSEFIKALGRLPRARRFPDRTSAMRLLFKGLLPEQILARPGKAQFNGAFFAGHSRELFARWQGEGVDSELVDLDSLRESWSSEEPDAASGLLLQSVWLALQRQDAGASFGQPLQQVASSIGQ
jgi:asparagine synthetase B (glutamine-hydrolysing)